jgi:multiple sugar transport system permease protein
MKVKASRAGWWGYVFISPWIIGFLCFVAGPMIASLILSFTDFNLVDARYVGLENFQKILGSDEKFWKALSNTLLYTLLAVPLGLTGSLLLAVLLNQNLKLKGVWRACFYIPTLVPAAAASFLWLYMFNEYQGLINKTLLMMGADAKNLPKWFNSTVLAMPTMVMMSLWGIGGARMIIFLAGLQNIPQALYEAASIDGASRWRQFWHVTMPMLSPVIFFNLILGCVGAFQLFTQAFLISPEGEPNNAMLFYAVYIFRQAFQLFHAGYASALAWTLFIILAVITAIQFFFARYWVHYEGDVK